MGRALKFLRFQIEMDGEMETFKMDGEMERWGCTMGRSCSLFLGAGRAAEEPERELGKNRNHDNIFLRMVKTRVTSQIVMRRRRKTTTGWKSLGTGSMIASLPPKMKLI